MSALHIPLKAEIAHRLIAVAGAAQAGDAEGAIFGLLDAFDGLGRDAAQHAWLAHHDADDRDELMQEHEEFLVAACLSSPWATLYPELPEQVEGVLRDAFEDEHFRLEDPIGWAVIVGSEALS